MLLTNGMLPDGKTFFCPSMTGTITYPWAPYYSTQVTYRTDVWQRLGGSDGRHLEYPADLSGLCSVNFNAGYVVLGSYHYRGMPAGSWNPCFWHRSYMGTFPYVKPKITTGQGVPPFKTGKMLAGRAIVIDSIDNVAPQGDYNNTFGIKGGAVRFHHNDGYNILYGDQHAGWYGDPQKWVAYAFLGGHNGYCSNNPTSYSASLGWTYCLQAPNLWAYSTYNDTQNPSFVGAQQIWHQFDVAAGIDQ
jgi:hypothetical protein